jgi:predicted MFS family arabinose efflux permease
VWTASAISFLATTADHLLLFVVVWVAAPQGWSGLQTALVVLVLRLPTLAGGVLGGHAVDRYGARPLIRADVTVRAALMGGLAVSGWHGELPLVAVLVVGGLAGGLAPSTYTGVRWLMPRYVDPERLGRANAALAVSDQLPLLVGAALAGPSLALLGPGRGMLVPAAMLALAAGLTLRLAPGDADLPARADQTPGGDLPPVRPFRSGRVVAVVALSTAYYLAYGPFETVSPAFVREQLGGGAGSYSLLWTLFGVGTLATLPLGAVLARRRPGLVNACGAVLWGLAMLPVAVVGDVTSAAVLFLVGGAIWGPYSAVEATALQRWTHPSRHGQVFGIQRSLLATAAPLGAAIGVVAVEHWSAASVLAASALACTLAGLAALTSADLRRSD